MLCRVCFVVYKGPTGCDVMTRITETGAGCFRVDYTPASAGKSSMRSKRVLIFLLIYLLNSLIKLCYWCIIAQIDR